MRLVVKVPLVTHPELSCKCHAAARVIGLPGRRTEEEVVCAFEPFVADDSDYSKVAAAAPQCVTRPDVKRWEEVETRGAEGIRQRHRPMRCYDGRDKSGCALRSLRA